MDNCDESYEPMDIDLSFHSDRDMDISYGDSTIILQRSSSPSAYELGSLGHHEKVLPEPSNFAAPVIKNYHIIKQEPVKIDINVHFKIVAAILILLLSVISYQIYNIECSGELNIEEFIAVLSRKVFGQSKVITDIKEALEVKAKSKILFFYGGTGVGKTFVASLLLEIIGLHSNVYHYTMPSFVTMSSNDVMLGVTLCQSSLFIVDDLTGEDMVIVDIIKGIVAKAENLHRNITMILIFGCQDSARDIYKKCDNCFNPKILENFSRIEAHKSFVKFEPLTEQHLRKCIEQEMGDRKLNDSEFRNIIPHFNVTLDGCKGVHSKMKYLNVV